MVQLFILQFQTKMELKINKKQITKTINIMHVEDNPGDARLIKEALKLSEQYINVSLFEDGFEAINFLNENKIATCKNLPDLILLDLNLPKINGHELLNRIKHDEYLKHIPVIILTSSESLDDITKAYNNYANCYLSKPVDLSDLIRMIKNIVYFWFSSMKLPIYG